MLHFSSPLTLLITYQVNPLARQYQQPTRLSDCWPHDVFHDVSKPLHLDIGCGKGGFLLDLASHETDGEYNYLGLEIRPGVAQYAQSRIERHNLEGKVAFVGCNANVDLERLLQRYHDETAPKDGRLTRVSIQFPDPHFKSQHQKRRVVNRSLIETLARYMPTDGVVFLQSDVQGVLDDMRARFRESSDYFRDSLDSVDYYHEENTTGVPTEREVSVLERGLPVHRSIFYRKEQNVVS